MLGLFLSTLAPNENTVIYLVLLVLFFQIIFAGVIFELSGPAQELSALTLSRWTMEGLGTSADMEGLNEFTRTHFRPDPITEEVSMEVPRLDDDWEPVSVVTSTEEIPVSCPSGVTITVPCPAPEITENEVVTVTETVTETRTFTPTVQEIVNEREFQINYDHTASHLCGTWLLLIGAGLFFGVGTLVVLKQKEAG
jgi:hypothetical protein